MSETNLQVKQLIDEYIKKAYFMQVGTSVDDQPWVCTVHFASDEKLHLIWVSSVESKHSQEIGKNPKVAGTIVLPFKPDEPVMGIQFQGVAKKVTDIKESLMLMQSYGARFGMDKQTIETIAKSTEGHMCYVITPSLFVLFDQIHFPDNPRQEYFVKNA
jgi:uncharacterized protein YhbP (UPF0306 family)